MSDVNLAYTYNPDVLNCLANLSSDEVFTPPEIANQMLDLLPEELWHDPEATFLDPATKTGVFLREIAKRLLAGLADQIPDLQERIDHIFHKQLFGIAITELTSLMARRSLYCSKYPNCPYSVSPFADASGNIYFRETQHRWVKGRCAFCGASQEVYDRGPGLETHAYAFIHTKQPEEIFNMKFDVIIGNPPYQLSTGGSGVQAIPLYDKFILQSIKLNPKYISMIVPARWFAGGFGLDSFRDAMLHDTRLKVIHDYPIASDCFGTGVQIKGGVCYFLWDRDYRGNCSVTTHCGNKAGKTETRPLLEKGCDSFIRYNEAVDILHKVWEKNEGKFIDLVSSQKPFGLPTNFSGKLKHNENDVFIYGNKGVEFYPRNLIMKNGNLLDSYKVFIPRFGSGSDQFPHTILGRPFVPKNPSACTETFLMIGPFETLLECKNVISYISTKFFRFLVMLLKPTQDALKKVYSFVPMQDFSKPWTDEELYAKYGLTAEEIAFIESMIRPMELDEEEKDE